MTMLLIAGLGNPGASHAGNRHNIGFMAADAIHGRHGFGPWRKKFKAEISEGALAGRKALIVKPQTYMNRSGEAVGQAMRFYRLGAENLVVLYDELDLEPGKVRVKTGGGAGGHNGIRSIDAHCGDGYRRVRLGIGHPGNKALVQRHVLGDFAKSDRQWLDEFLGSVADNFPLIAEGQDSTFMNRVSLAMKKRPESKSGRQDRIHQTPTLQPAQKPASGPMAAMLRKLFRSGDN